MNFKQIDCKNKELYFNLQPIKENIDVLESRFMFWDTLNSLAAKNIAVQMLRMA